MGCILESSDNRNGLINKQVLTENKLFSLSETRSAKLDHQHLFNIIPTPIVQYLKQLYVMGLSLK